MFADLVAKEIQSPSIPKEEDKKTIRNVVISSLGKAGLGGDFARKMHAKKMNDFLYVMRIGNLQKVLNELLLA